MQLDLSREDLLWDNVERVSLQRTRKAGSLQDSIDNVLKHAVSIREQLASGGVYQAGDVSFYLADRLLSPDLRPPKPGDKVTDARGTVWTILSVDARRQDKAGTQLWKLTTRNLSIHYDLRDLVTIETPVFSVDSSGARLPGWSTSYRNIPARVQLLTQAQADERGIRGGKGTYVVVVDREVDVLAGKDRIPWEGGYLQVVGYHNAERIDELPVIDAEAVP